MARLDDWMRVAAARMISAGIESARLEAQVLLAHALGVTRTWLLAHSSDTFDPTLADGYLARRLAREPLAYIVGEREFYGRAFAVTPHVLIPRQDTETLITAALSADAGIRISPSRPKGGDSCAPTEEQFRILDVGTGSGCIAITLALERPDWSVTASDISRPALEVARLNAERLGANVRLVESDLFAALVGERFDLIVSNPPYIADSESLMPEVSLHEPAVALFSGPTGLEVYERLVEEALDYLADQGWLMVEVGHTQASTVSELLRGTGFSDVNEISDLSGVSRVVQGRKEGES